MGRRPFSGPTLIQRRIRAVKILLLNKRVIVFASELELISLTLCSWPLLSVSIPFSRFKPKLMTGAVEQNCRVAHEVPSKSMGIMLGLAIITRAFLPLHAMAQKSTFRQPAKKISYYQRNITDLKSALSEKNIGFHVMWQCDMAKIVQHSSSKVKGDMNGSSSTRWHHYASSTADWRQKHHLVWRLVYCHCP